MDLCIISTVKDQIISHGLAVQHMGKKLRQGTVGCQGLKESRLKGGATYQNIKSNTVIKDPYTVSGMRWDDTDISGMQSVFDPLYRSVGSSVIQTENLKNSCSWGKTGV